MAILSNLISAEFIGSQGLTGIQGIQGLDGLYAAQGLQGLQGLIGLQGLDGLFAAQGIQGPNGIQGIQGISNSTGFIDVTNETSDATFYPVIADSVGNDRALKASTTNLQFNPFTGSMSATNFNSLSDVNAKTEINTINNAFELISNIRGVSFRWRDTGFNSLGVIAQELETVIPSAVTTSAGVKSVNYTQLIAVLIQAVKQLIEERTNGN